MLTGLWPALAAAAGRAAPVSFDADTVVQLARALAANAYVPPDTTLPPALAGANYDQYRDFRYRADKALWRDRPGVDFQAQFFHRGFLFKPRIEIHVVEDGQARELPFSTSLFDYSPNPTPALADTTGFAGFRLHAPLNSRAYFDELCVFLGASYFRAVGKGACLRPVGAGTRTRQWRSGARRVSGLPCVLAAQARSRQCDHDH